MLKVNKVSELDEKKFSSLFRYAFLLSQILIPSGKLPDVLITAFFGIEPARFFAYYLILLFLRSMINVLKPN
jgi:hypothetical protein